MKYEDMTQLALRGVVRDAIRRVIREDGLPGEHHFYITFLTRYPDVVIDPTLAEKYPEEITIVLEHQFWELSAHDEYFEVTLKFGGVPKYTKVPYLALTRFHDPSVGFALQFDRPEHMDLKPAPISEISPRPKPVTKSVAKPEKSTAKKTPNKKTTKKASKAQKSDVNNNADNKDGLNSDTPPSGDDNVVSLDSFRKKE
ncbi:MAG: ClpXP protease specificity-enhancing factor SspB [Maricaulaceae bacterium]